MRLVQDKSVGGYAIKVQCVKCHNMFTLADGYADLDGEAFVDYYCAKCKPVEVKPNAT